MKEKSSSPLFNTNNDDNEDCAINNQDVNNKHTSDQQNGTSNGQILHSINIGASNATNNAAHNQINTTANNSFNRAIGSRQSSPTDEVNNIGNPNSLSQLHSTQAVNEKVNSVNHAKVQTSVVKNNITKENSDSGSIENQPEAASSAPTQQINIDTSNFPVQVSLLQTLSGIENKNATYFITFCDNNIQYFFLTQWNHF